jgi:outer membrane protein assembly factor BamD
MIKNLNNILILIILISSYSCSSKKEPKITAEYLYHEAHKILMKKDYLASAEAFEKIDNEFPFTKWAIKGQVMSAYSYFKINEHEKTIQICDDFIKLHPNSEYIPYMLYIKALSYYDKIPTPDRSQEFTKEASFTFREIIARFGHTEYANDAKTRLDFVDDHLAGAKMYIARYQINNQNFIGAIKNFNEVINRYHSTNQVPEAYYRLAEIFFRIGAKDIANDIAIDLENKYPNNYWTKDAKKFKIINNDKR